ncbi:hypothetical protein PG991_004051 [Apiospora marii]|uniref:Major facilitator superfamily (MFS) profile domain-containing protein n=1 Tax=Apiospora marii TaxID=335849 RepID=A0ABR1S558_9PEZI
MVIAANIAEALSMSPTEMAWSTAASTLATGALLIPFGHLADIDVVPRKTFLLFSLAAFALLVALASLAPDGVVLNVLTGLAGVACAATIPAAVGILSLVYPRASRRKNIVFSSFLMGNPAATVIGGLVSGELASDYDWKPPFVFLAALYAFITVLGSIFVPNVAPGNSPDSMTTTPTGWSYASYPLMPGTKTRPTTLWLCLDKFDWLGTFLLLAGTLLCTVASTIGPGQSWETPTEKTTKTPMVPQDVWESWNIIMINLTTLSCSTAFYSGVFWVSTYLQEIEGLSLFEAAVRLLPQALMGLFLSPLVGLFMDKVSGTSILVAAALCSVMSNAILVFLRPRGDYLVWILPSLLLSTVGMDWTMNVGSLFILSSLPLKHHSTGGLLLQAMARFGVPLGLAITTAVWSSFDGKGGLLHPELAYSKVFMATTVFAVISLLLASLTRIGKQGSTVWGEDGESIQEVHRPSRRWTYIDAVSSAVASRRRMTRSASVDSFLSQVESQVSRRDTYAAKQALPPETVEWMVCERCGCYGRRKDIADPARYFGDVGIQELQKPNYDMYVNWSTKGASLVYHPRRHL